MDVETRELVYALIVAAEAYGPIVTRCGVRGVPWSAQQGGAEGRRDARCVRVARCTFLVQDV